MRKVVLTGLTGTNPLHFLASVGLLRIAARVHDRARLAFLDDGSYRPFVEGIDESLAGLVARDATEQAGPQPWRLQYGKVEKRGEKFVEDLKPPPETFRSFLDSALSRWVETGDSEGAAYAAAYGTSTAVDNKGNTKPTAFHFTAANQQFLGAIEAIRASIDEDWCRAALFEANALRPGGNVRWDPGADRNYALMADDPNTEGTSVNAPLEWLAFRALPLLPCVPIKARVFTTAVSGRGDSAAFSWPLWRAPASLRTVASLLRLPAEADARRGLFAAVRASIRRTSQGFGNFGPGSVSA
ncbi:MAG: hypothetical protein IAE78_16715 [Myxococcus sp.]|nr:hypothetical protein [Myxococcus sp.]